MSLLMLHGLDVMEAHNAAVTHLNAARRRGARGRTADVERAHRELGSRLTDGLRGDDTHRLADADGAAARQIASVAARAPPPPCRAGDGRAHIDLIDAFELHPPQMLLIQQRGLRV